MNTKAWRLLRLAGHQALLCLLCDKYSFNPNDIQERYCGYCHTYLQDIALDFQRQSVFPQHKAREREV
jgi:hypothetical protein